MPWLVAPWLRWFILESVVFLESLVVPAEVTYCVIGFCQAVAFGVVFASSLVLLRSSWRRPF